MNTNDLRRRETTRMVLNPPTFSPPVEMRKDYLDRLKAQLGTMIGCGKVDEWKPIVTIANHVRGTGAMYGFANIGDAAENLARAIQNGEAKSYEFLEEYAKVVNESYV